jgi:mannose-6-phosphate isomerase-like protein (cupin superfamily)
MPGQSTWRHHHRVSEEIYYVLAGAGVVAVGAKQHQVEPSSAVLIPAGMEHSATCLSEEPLVILCCCSPPYQDEDTVVTEEVLV